MFIVSLASSSSSAFFPHFLLHSAYCASYWCLLDVLSIMDFEHRCVDVQFEERCREEPAAKEGDEDLCRALQDAACMVHQGTVSGLPVLMVLKGEQREE